MAAAWPWDAFGRDAATDDLDFAERVPPYQGWLENVDVCGMAQVYPVDRNMNHGMENAIRYAERRFPERRAAGPARPPVATGPPKPPEQADAA